MDARNAEQVLLPLIAERIPAGAWLMLRQEGVTCLAESEAKTAGVHGKFLLYDARAGGDAPARRAIQHGQIAIDLDQLRTGWPFDPFQALVDVRSCRVAWDVGPGMVSEEVSHYPKADIRATLIARLRETVESHGGAWVRVWPFPDGYRCAFNFRIDHDDYEPRDFDAVLRAVEGNEEATSHYVCASGFQEQPAALQRLRPFDVGSHGWWHHSYRDAFLNRRNIERGIESLERAGLAVNGYVAPHGRWNRELAKTLAELGVGHSSEFALAHDDVPFHLSSSGPKAAAGVLQIPVHPVCLGLFQEAGIADESSILDYFGRVMRKKHEQGQPIFLYGHPTGRLGRRPALLHHVLGVASSLPGLWKTNLTRFAAWWRVRTDTRVTVFAHERGLRVRMTSPASEWKPALEVCRGEASAVVSAPTESFEVTRDHLRFERRPTETWPLRIPLPPETGWRRRVRNWLDWELVTPHEEIAADNLRGLAKRSLRRLRDRLRVGAVS